MLKTIFSWVSGRGKAVVVVVVALTVLTSGTAMAITYTSSKRASLKLNKPNFVATALTKLASNAVGPALTLETDSTDPSATPLKLDTEVDSQAPMSVDSSTKVTNLNADALDSVDSTGFQRRVSGSCTVGSSIRSIAQDGTVVCEPDGVTGREIVTNSSDFDNTGFKSTVATCPGGKIAISGGAIYSTDANSVVQASGDAIALVRSIPSESTPGANNRWAAAAAYVGGGTVPQWRVIAHVVCINA